jgi:hypothetical protein
LDDPRPVQLGLQGLDLAPQPCGLLVRFRHLGLRDGRFALRCLSRLAVSLDLGDQLANLGFRLILSSGGSLIQCLQARPLLHQASLNRRARSDIGF